MGKFIPNEETYVSFGLVCVDIRAPKVSELTAAKVLTGLMTGLNASATGNSVPTPSFDTLFETSIPGTSTATFSADFYRDDAVLSDKAWTALPRFAKGFFFIKRFGGGPDVNGDPYVPAAGDVLEVWPVRITSRAHANMTNNTAVTFTVNAAVPVEPYESAVVAA